MGRSVAPSSSTPLRFAYADPPYPGRSRLYYGDHPDYAGEVDHADLMRRLSRYDGWALSTAADALPDVLALCPPGTCVAAWVKGERPNRRARRPLNGWEPVLYFAPRLVVQDLRDASCVDRRRVDYLVHGTTPRTTDPARVVGAKPAAFARWLFDLLGAQAGDTLDDLFPGSGGIARAWEAYTSRHAGETRRVALTGARDASQVAASDASIVAAATGAEA